MPAASPLCWAGRFSFLQPSLGQATRLPESRSHEQTHPADPRTPIPGHGVMRVDDLRSLSLFDGLSDAQLAELVEAGTEVRIEPGVDLFHEGEHADFWWVLLDGAIDLRRHAGREENLVGKMDTPGRWAGGFRAWDEHGVYLA